jgi:hypothetical protein
MPYKITLRTSDSYVQRASIGVGDEMKGDGTEKFEFAVGETYSNRQRQYTVLGIQGTKLLVRFDDGSTGTLDTEVQRRIIANMALELKSLTRGVDPANLDLRRKFIFSIGFLATSADLQAEVPPKSRASFERKYRDIKGRNIPPTVTGYYPLIGDDINKWGPELRIYFYATEAEIDELYFGEYVEVRDGTQPAQYRINNNAFFYQLLGMGFDFGPEQDIDRIQQSIPASLRGEFDCGVTTKKT